MEINRDFERLKLNSQGLLSMRSVVRNFNRFGHIRKREHFHKL